MGNRFGAALVGGGLVVASLAAGGPDVAAKAYRQVEHVRQEKRALPAAGCRSLVVDGWGAVTIRGAATGQVSATAVLHGYGPTEDDAQRMLETLRWYLDPSGPDSIRVGGDGPRPA